MSPHQRFFVGRFCCNQAPQRMKRLLLFTFLCLFSAARDFWLIPRYEMITLCNAISVNINTRIINKLSDYEIQTSGIEQNLTRYDQRDITNRLQTKPNLMSMRYTISRRGTPKEICVLTDEKKNGSKTHQDERCQTTKKRRSCNLEFVLINKMRIIKDCISERLSEVCVTKTRTQLTQRQLVLCQTSERFMCMGGNKNQTYSKEAIKCYPNRLAVCHSKPKIVTVTETQQLCGKEFQAKTYRTTKMCITYEHDTDETLVGDWKCLNFEHMYERCSEKNIKKQIRSEISRDGKHTKMECMHKGR